VNDTHKPSLEREDIALPEFEEEVFPISAVDSVVVSRVTEPRKRARERINGLTSRVVDFVGAK
jgi:hypothetical protein